MFVRTCVVDGTPLGGDKVSRILSIIVFFVSIRLHVH